MTLLEALHKLKADGPVYRLIGICGNIEKLLGHPKYSDTQPLRNVVHKWARARGRCVVYPIENSTLAYDAATDKWANPERHALLDHIIRELENDPHQYS